MPDIPTPLWIWFVVGGIVLVTVVLAAILIGGIGKPRPERAVVVNGVPVELWVRERRLPSRSDAIVVPAAPDLKLAVGIAKWVRDATAGKAQGEANRMAPLPPGQACIVGGARYRFDMTALAVVMDDQKRTSSEWIAGAVRRSLELAGERGASTCVIPDMTEDLLRRPPTVTDEQRRETARPIAAAIVKGIADAAGAVATVRLWMWREDLADVYRQELARAGSAERVPAA
jgi:O-acetyl-ADP-ribose deacetylase (regulator of RNase III)